jgi:hypothetical protein
MGRTFWIWRSIIFAVAGLGYGLYLSVFGLAAAGAGHGSYVVTGIVSSPLGLLQNTLIAWVGTPLLWCIVGFCLSETTHRVGRVVFLAMMFAHYGCLFFVLRSPGVFADWHHARKILVEVIEIVCFYAAGQIGIWVVFFMNLRKPRTLPE